ncbi:MAG: hypothetical protein E7055_09670 [Lentisphaerae bacterium]|nr:hypothetical protein [Lentisphaerota bacterium]
MKTFFVICGLFTVYAAFAAPIYESSFKSDVLGKEIFRQYSKKPVMREMDGKAVVFIPGGSIGRSRKFDVKPGARILVRARARNAAKSCSLEGNPAWEGMLTQRGIKGMKALNTGGALVFPVFYDASGKLRRMPPHQSTYLRRIYSSEWKEYVMEFFVPAKCTGMALWFSGGSAANGMELASFSAEEVQDAPTLNINPELKLENLEVRGIEHYINTQIDEGTDGRAELSFPQGNILTCRFPVKPGTKLCIAATTRKNSIGCRMFVDFQDKDGKKCGSLKDHVMVRKAEDTRMETDIGVPAEAATCHVLIRFGSLTGLWVTEEK